MKIVAFKEKHAKSIAEIANEAFMEEIKNGMPIFSENGINNSSKKEGVKIFILLNEKKLMVTY